MLPAGIYKVYRTKREAGRGIEQPLPQLKAHTWDNEFAPDPITVVTPLNVEKAPRLGPRHVVHT